RSDRDWSSDVCSSDLVAAGTLTQVVRQPQVRVLKLVPIVTVHVNDASGVPTAPYGVGAEATVSGTVTVNWSGTNTDIYVQDGTRSEERRVGKEGRSRW